MSSRSDSTDPTHFPTMEAGPIVRRQFRAPAADGSVLAVPDLMTASSLVEANQKLWTTPGIRIAGIPLPQFRELARQEFLEISRHLVNDWNLPTRPPAELTRPLIMTGHQPVFAHPGVWIKHIAASALAQKVAGTGVNLIVDNDQSHPLDLAVPTGSVDHVHMEHILLDDKQPQQPWEERHLHNRAALEQAGSQCHELLHPWGWDPLAKSYWNTFCETPGHDAVQLLSRARIVQEASWGVHNLEVPISRLADSQSFGLFALQLILDAPQFHKQYNRAVTDYRHENQVTNPGQPVPFLASAGHRYELPFWLWRTGDQQRLPLFVEKLNEHWQLQAGITPVGELPADQPLDAALLTTLRTALTGWKLRPRALTTTLFARMALADLFIHGIGGAKYDEMADQLMQEFWGLPAPAFLTLTATLRLPIEIPPVSEDDLRSLKRQIRDLHFNPARQLDLPIDHPYREQKAQLIAEQQQASATRGLTRRERRARRPQNRQRHRAFTELAASLAPEIAQREQELRTEVERITTLLSAKQQLLSREIPAVLHPEDRLLALFDTVRQQLG